MGLASLGLSLRTRMPVLATWSTPGLALLAMLSGSLHHALAEAANHDSAIIAFLITASDISLLDIGSASRGDGLAACLNHLVLSQRHHAENFSSLASPVRKHPVYPLFLPFDSTAFGLRSLSSPNDNHR